MVISVVLMLAFVRPISSFISRNPDFEILGLFVLLLIGFVLFLKWWKTTARGRLLLDHEEPAVAAVVAQDRIQFLFVILFFALVHVIERPDFKTWKRDKRDTRRAKALFESWAGANPETWPEFDLKKTERAINTLHIDGQGRLWVQHSRSNRDLPDGTFLVTATAVDRKGLQVLNSRERVYFSHTNTGTGGRFLADLGTPDGSTVIELANGGDGYIPPPEQHLLGGYNTWPARSAVAAIHPTPATSRWRRYPSWSRALPPGRRSPDSRWACDRSGSCPAWDPCAS